MSVDIVGFMLDQVGFRPPFGVLLEIQLVWMAMVVFIGAGFQVGLLFSPFFGWCPDPNPLGFASGCSSSSSPTNDYNRHGWSLGGPNIIDLRRARMLLSASPIFPIAAADSRESPLQSTRANQVKETLCSFLAAVDCLRKCCSCRIRNQRCGTISSPATSYNCCSFRSASCKLWVYCFKHFLMVRLFATHI